MKDILMLVSVLFLVTPLCAFALEPAQAKGKLVVNGKTVQISSASALLHDNAEKILDTPKELRILLTDREVPESALSGLVFLEVDQMAKEGQVQGLLLKLDPNDLSKVLVTLLYKPADPNSFLMTQTLSSSKKDIIRNFRMASGVVSGEIEHHDEGDPSFESMPKIDYSIKFKAQIANAPAITADLKGKEAQQSPQVAALRKKADAMSKGDMKAAMQFSSSRSNKAVEGFLSQAGPEAVKYMKEGGVEMKKEIKKIKRVVVRGERAVAIFEGNNQWAKFVKEDGEWKSDD